MGPGDDNDDDDDDEMVVEQERSHRGFGGGASSSSDTRDNQPPGGELGRKGRRNGHGHGHGNGHGHGHTHGHGHHKGHHHGHQHKKQGGRKEKARQGSLLPEVETAPVLKDRDVFTMRSSSSSSSSSSYSSSNQSPVLPSRDPSPTSRIPVTTVTSQRFPTKHKKSGRRGKKGQEEVMPTLDMALFNWEDYEDMKLEVDSSPTKKKGQKGKRRSKNMSNVNRTMNTDTVEPCDHHLDCLPGSCCDLRRHECKQHNRGLNNKCYDDCMCEEGLRCYAKFHRKRRVTRETGRCVEPDSANLHKGAFIPN
ncbi:draxin [Engraulis encrasicolus]|uniref:draxin n=1 Tax=Engraulis encrasicolus TaxID=184585 RepID=UPI002FD2EC09